MLNLVSKRTAEKVLILFDCIVFNMAPLPLMVSNEIKIAIKGADHVNSNDCLFC